MDRADKNDDENKKKVFPRQREDPDTSTFGECDASDKSKLSHSPGIIKEVDCDMAERRMFSQKIVQSSKFLQMPKTSQCLYFHLGLRADDDGVVEAYPVMNMVKANEDDFRVLVAKGYVSPLNDYMVSYIVDWPEQNKIRPDRKQDSIYQDLLLQKFPNLQLQKKTQRSDTKRKSSGRSMDGQLTAQYRVVEDSEGKGRKGEESAGQNSCSSSGDLPSEERKEHTVATTAISQEINTSVIPMQEMQQKTETGSVKFSLGKEILTEDQYQELISEYPQQYVDETISRILKTPYMHCLNMKTIRAWTQETQQRINASLSLPIVQGVSKGTGKNSFLNFPQRQYDYEEIAKKLAIVDGLAAKEE